MRRTRLICAQLSAFVFALGAVAVNATACEGGGGGGGELTSLSTKLSGGGTEGETLTVAEGTKVKDKATLTGKDASKATGKVAYKVYSENTCKTLVASAGEVTVSGESVPASNEEELEAGKSYYWQAHYGGDTNNAESTSPCSEILTVQAKTSLSTMLSGESKEAEELTVLEGSKVKDKATLSGTNSSTATGKALYKVFSDSKCEHLVKEAGEVTVTSGSIPASSEVELTGGASYYWRVTYKGDSLHQESTSTCDKEISTIKAKTMLSTSLSGEKQAAEEITVVQDASASDAATISGAAASLATGTVKYDVYSNEECKELVTAAGEATVSGAFVPSSNSETLSPGIYYWQASYSGDKLNAPSTSTCTEVEVVTPEVTSLLTAEGQSYEQLEILEGSAAKDAATLRGEFASSATGKVKYAIYSDGECKTLVKEAGEVTVSGASVPSSNEETLSPGTYYWQASYSGDSKNPAAKGACGEEVVVVTTATSLSTSLSGESKSGAEIEVKEGSAVHDTATLGGTHAATAGGYIEYNVYSDSECKDLVALAGSGEVTSGSVPKSSEETLPAGTYYWQAMYSGEGVNHSTTSTCGAEKAIVTAPVTTSLSGDSHTGPEIEVEEGDGVKDTATLHGEHASIATGTVKYAVYSDSQCKTLVKEAGEVTVSGASVPASNEETLSPGLYYWQASYSGDSKNSAAKSACVEAVAVVRSEFGLYGALGDSFSSGEGAGAYYAKTNVAGTNVCHRSKAAYPVRIMEAMYTERKDFVEEPMIYEREPPFIFRACSGALAKQIWETNASPEWVEPPGEWAAAAPQKLWLEHSGPPTKPNGNIVLVTLTIGGNDAGFGTIARNCIQGPFLIYPGRATCKEVISEWASGVAGVRNTLNGAPGLPSLKASLTEALKAIHKAAPNARIRIPLYPQILNTKIKGDIRLDTNENGYTIENNADQMLSVAVALEEFTRKLNETIANTVLAAAAEGEMDAKVIPATVTALNGHRLGDNPSWVNTVLPFAQAESLHPNCNGQLALATAILPSLGLDANPDWKCG
jgi:hypothetical protein